ncbi:MAG TPA: hypothetical protein VKV28_01550 [Candidatus Binataceae bacterium]|nr:hypothetical protein [Candidatus Binataceae bacterium]
MSNATAKPASRRINTLLLVVLGAAFIGFVFYSLFRIEPLQITSAHLERRGSEVLIAGDLYNRGPDLRQADLSVSLFDAQGRLLVKREVELGPLRHQSRRSFVSPAMSAPQAASFTLAVDRGTNMYGN